jgi:PAS domain S-box-containing protein
MGNLIHILHLEDDALDAELIQVTLELAGLVCQINRVQNRDEFSQALHQGNYDVILGDYRLPTYDGVSALRLARELRPDLPFIFVSGTLGEDAAIESFTQGATDYVLKQKLSRLAPAVERARREAENRRERIRAERALRESEAKFSTAFRSSPSALSVSTAKDHVYIDANDSFMEWTGYTRVEVMGHTSIELKLWADPDQDREFRRLLHEHGSVYNFEYAYRRKDGDVRYALVSATFITIGGEPCVLAQSNDITERKRVEGSLWESSQMLQLVLDNMPAFVFWKDRHSVYLGCNDLFAANAGLSSPQAISGLTDLDLPWKYAEAESYRADDRFVMETGLPKLNYEETQLTADGRITDVRTSKVPLRNPAGDVIGVLGTFEDITERKRAETRILRLNRLYATLSQINQTIVHVRDQEKLFHEICRVAVEHGQFRLAWISLIDDTTYRVEPVAYAGEEQGYFTAITITYRDEPLRYGPTGTAIRTGRCVVCQDIATDVSMIPWRDQALQRGYRSSAAVPFRQHGRVIGALTVFAAEPLGFDAEDEQLLDEIGLDISFALDALEQEAQRRQAEAELNELNAELEQRVLVRTVELARAHEHLRAILDTAGEGVVFTDLHGTIEYVNPAMERLTGYQATEVIGRNPRVWKSDQTSALTHRHMWNTLTNGEIWQGELINRRKDGSLYDAALTTAPLTNSEGQTMGFVGVQRDITRQKELDRMKDQFVSNVSHELRTPLANILLHVDLLEHGKPDKLTSYLQTLRREAERLRKLIEDLLDLSRLDRNVAPIQLTSIDLNQLLEHLVADRSALAERRSLKLTYEPAPDLPFVLTDTSKLIQVASNLMTNALNYTPTGGVVKVEAEVRQHEGQRLATFTVRDTGPGISPQDLPHLFERFYRGAAGRQASAPGTGLGLAISQEIMKRLGGRITVESEVGRGAAFTVWLPLASSVSNDH